MPGDTCPTAARRSPASRSTPAAASAPPTTARCSSPTTPQLHLGDARAAATACPTPPPAQCSSRARRAGRPPVRPGRRPVLRRHQRRHDPPHPRLVHATRRRPRWPPPTRPRGAAPLTVTFDGRGSSDPDRRHAQLRLGPRRRRPVRRLDVGDASRTYTTAGTVTVGLRVTDPGGHQRHRRADDHRRHAADGDDHLAGRRHDLEGRRHDHLLGRGDRLRGTRCRRPR